MMKSFVWYDIKSWKLRTQTISTCRDVCDKVRDKSVCVALMEFSPLQCTGKVSEDTNHKSLRHDFCCGLSWFVRYGIWPLLSQFSWIDWSDIFVWFCRLLWVETSAIHHLMLCLLKLMKLFPAYSLVSCYFSSVGDFLFEKKWRCTCFVVCYCPSDCCFRVSTIRHDCSVIISAALSFFLCIIQAVNNCWWGLKVMLLWCNHLFLWNISALMI